MGFNTNIETNSLICDTNVSKNIYFMLISYI